jgi:hypothetical protein
MAGILAICPAEIPAFRRLYIQNEIFDVRLALFHSFLDKLPEVPEGPVIGVTSVTAATKRWRDP